MKPPQINGLGLITPRYSRAQTVLLDSIGVALARHRLSWDEAVALRDRVRVGELKAVRGRLNLLGRKLKEAA